MPSPFSCRRRTFGVRQLALPVLLMLVAFALAGCDAMTDDDLDPVRLTGRVIDVDSGEPVSGVLVTLTLPLSADASDEAGDRTTTTDAEGRYTFEVRIEGAIEATVTVSKDGVTQERKVSLSSSAGAVEGFDFQLSRAASGQNPNRTSGRASNIFLGEQSHEAIRVVESGGPEVARITFVAVDSTGTPIDLDNVAEVRFRAGQAPADVSIQPEVVRTNARGEATVNVASGTTAGVVQVIAEISVEGEDPIRSRPVQLAIHGGLPDFNHFTVGPERFNFPGRVRFGLRDPISVLIGDRYSNPVVPNTSVYFSTSHGVVVGSAQTSDDGEATADLISGRPLPDEDGVAIVTAHTVNDSDEQIVRETAVVMSGRTNLRITTVPAGGLGTYAFSLSDDLGNPLVGGTSVSVTAEGTNVEARGNTEVELDDTAISFQTDGAGRIDRSTVSVATGQGITEFSFSVTAGDGDEVPRVDAVVLNVTSENGDVELTSLFGGTNSAGSTPRLRTSDKAVAQVLGDGTIEVRSIE